MSKFTAGEWLIDNRVRRVSCPTVCTIRKEISNKNIPPQTIANIPLMSFGEGTISKQEAEANARLIAAAPEMYGELYEALQLLQSKSSYDGDEFSEQAESIRELLARIDGKEAPNG